MFAIELIVAQSRFDRTDPDYEWISAEFSRRFREEVPPQTPIDWARVNGGDWKQLCVFGPYSDPILMVRSMGGILAPEDAARVQLKNQYGLFRLASVEETESLIAYRRGDDRMVIIHMSGVPHFDYGGGCYRPMPK